jgi:hypothetical protein
MCRRWLDRGLVLGVAVAAGAMTFLGAAWAGCGGTYVFCCGFVLDPPTVTDGQVHIIGSGFAAGDHQFFIEGEPLGTATVDPDDVDGNIDVTFALPPAFLAPGQYEITVECGGLVASNIIIVGGGEGTTTSTTAAAPDLPVTGGSWTAKVARLGVGLVLVGGLTLALTHRRRRRSASAPT